MEEKFYKHIFRVSVLVRWKNDLTASIAPQKHTSFALSPRKARTHAKEREREREKEREAFCVENTKEEEAFGEL